MESPSSKILYYAIVVNLPNISSVRMIKSKIPVFQYIDARLESTDGICRGYTLNNRLVAFPIVLQFSIDLLSSFDIGALYKGRTRYSHEAYHLKAVKFTFTVTTYRHRTSIVKLWISVVVVLKTWIRICFLCLHFPSVNSKFMVFKVSWWKLFLMHEHVARAQFYSVSFYC